MFDPTQKLDSSSMPLSSGHASLHLLRMGRPGLLFGLREALDEACEPSKEVERRNLLVMSQ